VINIVSLIDLNLLAILVSVWVMSIVSANALIAIFSLVNESVVVMVSVRDLCINGAEEDIGTKLLCAC
jgi:hypothetical protein